MDAKVLFFGCDLFEVKNHRSIKCENIKEIEDLVLKGKIHFIIFSEKIDKIDEVVSSLRSFFFQNKLSVYPVLIQGSQNILNRNCGGWTIYKEKIIPKIIEGWLY